MATEPLPLYKSIEDMRDVVIRCERCPRLVAFRQEAPIRTVDGKTPWRKPIPGFGDPQASLLILGLAPSANGGNRTGRIFTGDASGKFLMSALHKMNYANLPDSISADDGLLLRDCYITATVKCVPPQNSPTPQEFKNCHPYFLNELLLLKNLKSVLALGKIAFDAYLLSLRQRGVNTKGITFKHGGHYPFDGMPTLFASYHPSPQNTNTGVLTEKMFLDVLGEISR